MRHAIDPDPHVFKIQGRIWIRIKWMQIRDSVFNTLNFFTAFVKKFTVVFLCAVENFKKFSSLIKTSVAELYILNTAPVPTFEKLRFWFRLLKS